MSVTRRALLGGAVALGATACRSRRRPRAAHDLDAGALAAARDTERALLAAYDAAIARGGPDVPSLTRLRADHAAHLRALRAGPTPATAVRPAGDLRTAERASAVTLRAAAVAAVGGRTAALLASIAASHAAHAAALAPLVNPRRR